MEADASLIPLLDQLIVLFNRRSMDVPEGIFRRETQFLLNGVPFEAMFGRSPSDPLILMLARGAAGYRFTAKAVHHAIPDARLERGELEETTREGQSTIRGQCWLSGHLRGNAEPTGIILTVELTIGAGRALQQVSVTLDDVLLAQLREARLRP